MARPEPSARRPIADRSRAGNERLAAHAFLLPALLLFGVFILAPTIGTFALSLFEWSGGGEAEFVGLRNFRIAFTGDAIFLKALGNNVYYMLATLVVEVALGLVLALMLDLKRRGYGLFRVVIFTPMTLSLTVDGEKQYRRVVLRSCFPVSQETRYLSVRDASGEEPSEIGVIEGWTALDDQDRQAVAEELGLHYFVPAIHRVLEVKDELGFLYWTVDTDKGHKEFVMRNNVIRHARELPLRETITHTFPLARADEAYRLFDTGKTGKIALVWQ